MFRSYLVSLWDVTLQVVNRTMITLSLSTASAQWTEAENVGDLTIKVLHADRL